MTTRTAGLATDQRVTRVEGLVAVVRSSERLHPEYFCPTLPETALWQTL